MCEVTNKNFEEKYAQIIADLESSSFISIDCEFSGMYDDDNKCSLFDTPKARFNKLQSYLKNFIIIQFGLSTFKYERNDNTFTVATYTFYLKPSAFKDEKFMCQMKSIEFLCKNQFDFNKFFYDGIEYLNKSIEAETMKMIEDEKLSSFYISEEIQTYCSKVAKWRAAAPEGSEMLLELTDETNTFVFLLHLEIRKRFPNVWTYVEENSVIRVKKVNDSEKTLLLSNREENFSIKKALFDCILGFSRILKKLENLKKPIIGHNFLLDLMLIYKQFYNPLPVSYKTFKKAVSEMFPNIYDTKTISFRLRDFLTRNNTWMSNALSDLYLYLKEGKGSCLVIFTPLINHVNEDYLNELQFHEAGFDSFCTGFCFLKMAHMFSLWDKEKKAFILTAMYTSTTWLLSSVASMKNHVNLSRALVNHIVLSGEDPKNVQRGFLYIESKTDLPLDNLKILELMMKHASVDIQSLSKCHSLMAVSNIKQTEEILDYFQNNDEFRIVRYNYMKHSALGKFIVSGLLFASATVLVKLASKVWRK